MYLCDNNCPFSSFSWRSTTIKNLNRHNSTDLISIEKSVAITIEKLITVNIIEIAAIQYYIVSSTVYCFTLQL